jgi:hypothetical protein
VLSSGVCLREEDRFYIEAPLWQKVGDYNNDATNQITNFSPVGTRRYEIRAPSAALAQVWVTEIQRRVTPTRIYGRGFQEHKEYLEWISNAEANAGKPIPEDLHKRSLLSIDKFNFWSYKQAFGYFGNLASPDYGVYYFRDYAGCVFDSQGKYYPSVYFVLYGVMPPPGLPPANEVDFENRPYPRAQFEPRFNDEVDFAIKSEGRYVSPVPSDYKDLSIEEFAEKYKWPADQKLRKIEKMARGVPLGPEDLTPPPSPRRDRSDSDGEYGGSSSSYNYDEPTIEAETAYQAPQGMSPEERRQKELQHRLDQWERQCRQIESANDKMKSTFERQMNNYEKKHRDWQKTTGEKCGTCKGSSKRDCTQCKGSGRGTGGKECLTCRGKAKFDCLHCSSHKGLEYGSKGKYSEPKPPSKPNYKDLPRKPT